MKTDQELHWEAMRAALSGGAMSDNSQDRLASWADTLATEAVALHRERFPVEAPQKGTPSRQFPLSGAMFKTAIVDHQDYTARAWATRDHGLFIWEVVVVNEDGDGVFWWRVFPHEGERLAEGPAETLIDGLRKGIEAAGELGMDGGLKYLVPAATEESTEGDLLGGSQ